MKQLNNFKRYAGNIGLLTIMLLPLSSSAPLNNPRNSSVVWFERDDDLDGFPAGIDCDDWNRNIHPGATEVCNWQDDNCDGRRDEGCIVFYIDGDRDFYGNWEVQTRAMSPPDGYAFVGGDCNDINPEIHPNQLDICNGINDDCDGIKDEDCQFGKPAGDKSRDLTSELVQPREFNIAAYPNPGKVFNLRLQGDNSNGNINVRVFDAFGRVVETKNNLSAGQVVQLGGGYANGAYILEAVQGMNRKIIRVLKL